MSGFEIFIIVASSVALFLFLLVTITLVCVAGAVRSVVKHIQHLIAARPCHYEEEEGCERWAHVAMEVVQLASVGAALWKKFKKRK